MNKKHLIEFDYVPADFEILEKSDGVLRCKVKWQQADVINNNKRMYRRSILEREIKRIQNDLKIGKVFSCAYHPKSGSAEVPDVAAIWRSAEINKDGSCTGIIEFVGTNAGKDAEAIKKAGGQLGISSRGYGTTTQKVENGKAFAEVNNDFVLKSPGDIVLSPSVPDAGVREMVEKNADNFELTKKELKLREEFFSLRDSLNTEVKERFGTKAWVVDFSNLEVVFKVEDSEDYQKIDYQIKNNKVELGKTAKVVVKKIQYEQVKEKYLEAVSTGYKGEIEDFKKLYEQNISFFDDKDLSLELSIIKVAEEENLYERYEQALLSSYSGSFKDFKILIAKGLTKESPQERVKREEREFASGK